VTLAICPGICNSSESVYIRRVVYHAQLEGFRVAVLNHLGVLKTLTLTSPRIFNYGNTSDYHLMIEDLLKRFPTNRFICVGFSMGANLVTKYLGEMQRSKSILAGISICQGYDAKEATKYLLAWEGFRRIYFFVMTENMRGILRRWQKQLFPDDFKQKHEINERAIWSAATLVELDEAYTRRILGCKDLEQFYQKSSCAHVLDKINIPMIFVNSTDDPIVPPPLLNIIRKSVAKQDNFLFIEQKYGGHLGFYEGGLIYPNPLSWLDRLVVQMAEALTVYSTDVKSKAQLDDNDDNDEEDEEKHGLKKHDLNFFREIASQKTLLDQEDILKKDDGGEVLDVDHDIDEQQNHEEAVLANNSFNPTLSSGRPSFVCRKRTVANPNRKRRALLSAIA